MTSDPLALPETSGRSRMVLLGLLSFGLVGLLLATIVGVGAFLFRDQLVAPATKDATEKRVADAAPRQTDALSRSPSTPTPAARNDAPPAAHDDPREEAEPRPRRDRQPTSAPVEEAPEPAAPSREVAPDRRSPPIADQPKTEVRREPEPAKPVPLRKVEEPKAVERPPEESPPPRVETTKPEAPATPFAEPRRLSGDQVYRRLVKASVLIVNGEGWGSGAVVHRDRRLVLTNYHVVGDSASVSVSSPRYDRSGRLIVEGDFYVRAFKNREFVRGKVIKLAKNKDLALVQLDQLPEDVPVLKLSARGASPGQTVHSVGNPGASDARWSYTSGTVRQLSHKTWKVRLDRRTILSFDADILETQSPTNPGDSGGPLVNDALELVGVTHGADVTARELSLFIDVSEVKKLLEACDVPLTDVVAAPGEPGEGGGLEGADVRTLVQHLQSPDAARRSEAARRLGELGPEARSAARALKKAIKDEDVAVRRQAVRALGRLGPDARDLVRRDVVAAVRDDEASVRTAALQALADLGPPDETEVPVLLSALHQAARRREFKSCLYAARSLARMGPEAREAVPDLRIMLRTEDREVQGQALEALRKIGPGANAAAPDVAELLKGSDRSLRMQAAFVLLALDPTAVGEGKGALSVLILALRPESTAEKDDLQTKERLKEIRARLVKAGEPAADRLLRAIQGDFRAGRGRKETAALDAAAREAALKIIAEIGRDAYSNTLISALAELQRADPSRAVRDAAREAYIKIQRND